MLLLGIDLGTSSVKVSVVDADTQQLLASASWPETEAPIYSPAPGWAEQNPENWWDYVQTAILKCHAGGQYDPRHISAIGIAYQMHGLVLTNPAGQSIRNSIIWCDSRAVNIGDKAYHDLGESYCQNHLLNSPGNFTASKLYWVQQHEPFVYNRIHQYMLPGDFIALRLTGEASTTSSALSEGIMWDFQEDAIARPVLDYYGLDAQKIPRLAPVFSIHGTITQAAAEKLSLKPGIPVSYKAGDQPNNALALNVLQPGEVAATAGTSGVIYAVTDQPESDPQSRVNSFVHVNHHPDAARIGVLLCINGVGIMNKWVRELARTDVSYDKMNQMAASVPEASEGLLAIPFGNGAERMLGNRMPGARFLGIDLNKHQFAHMARATQEGIAFAFRYGLDIMRENGMHIDLVRAGRANLFLSDVFTQSFASINNLAVEFYEGDGSFGAALGAAVGAGIYKDVQEMGSKRQPVRILEPTVSGKLESNYQQWKTALLDSLRKMEEQRELVSDVS